uniref:G-protein coupled receptors family 1 profile domain-containing protein n=1 Tax=Erpetoichthys calabaricus TaxID=27687 RepID=A0A8C4X3Z6_ERPCA
MNCILEEAHGHVIMTIRTNPVYGNSSGNSSYPKRSQPAAVYVLLYFFSASLVILTVCGNLLVIISISHFRQLHTPTNILVLSLAVADFLIGIFGIPFAMIKTIENCWYFGDIFCLVYNLITFISTSVSISNLVFIAVDRYVAICDPLQYTSTITVSFAGCFTAVGWVFSLVYTVIIISINGIDSIFVIVDLIITFILPCSAMIILYLKVFIVAEKHAKIISNTIQDYKQGKKNISKKSERKAAKTLGIVMGVFLLCWVPYYLCGLIDSYLNFNTCIMVDLIITFILPFSAMIILYFKVFTVAKKHANLINSTVQNCKGGNNNISKTSERKAAKKLGIVIGIFLLCWIPYYLCGITDSYLHVTAPPLAKNIFISLAYINSSINPIIYALIYPWFQKSVSLIITLKILSPESSLTSLFKVS